MMLIITTGLVLASLVLLIVGFVQDRLVFIYVSMLCSGVAGVALIIFVRLARRRAAKVASGLAAGARSTADPQTDPRTDHEDGPRQKEA